MLDPELGRVELGNVIPNILMSLLYDCIILVGFLGLREARDGGEQANLSFQGATDDLRRLGERECFKTRQTNLFQQSAASGYLLDARPKSSFQIEGSPCHSRCRHRASECQPCQVLAPHFLFLFIDGVFHSFRRTVAWERLCYAISNASLFRIF